MVIQVVEDDPAIERLLRRNLELDGFEIIVSRDGVAALDQFEEQSPDLVLLDIGIPQLSGLEVCRHLRINSDVPVVMVTSSGLDDDVVRGLEAGADDYLSKPFNGRVLRARVQAVLRRKNLRLVAKEDEFQWGGLAVNFEKRKVTLHGDPVHLTPIEFKLLSILVQCNGKVLTSNYLLSEVWGPNYEFEFQILRTHVSRLRRKIEDSSRSPELILTEPGVGIASTYSRSSNPFFVRGHLKMGGHVYPPISSASGLVHRPSHLLRAPSADHQSISSNDHQIHSS